MEVAIAFKMGMKSFRRGEFERGGVVSDAARGENGCSKSRGGYARVVDRSRTGAGRRRRVDERRLIRGVYMWLESCAWIMRIEVMVVVVAATEG
jgi:hypothetical protein